MNKTDDKYLRLKVDNIDVQVKMEDEGIVLDVFQNAEVIATTYKFYNEFGVVVTEEESK